MDALETMSSKKKECKDLKEKKIKERDDMFFALEQQRIDDKKVMEQKRLEEKMAMEQKKITDQMALEKTKHEEKMVIEEKRLQLLERELDDKVMAMDLSGMNEVQQEYYRECNMRYLLDALVEAHVENDEVMVMDALQ
jgi:hypothetical protein